MNDFMIELSGTPEDVQAMLNVASYIDGAKAYKKRRIHPGLCYVFYRGKGTPNDLVLAIKRKAGLIKSKPKSKPRRVIAPKPEEGSDDGI